MQICFDLDETICITPSSRKYEEAIPYIKVIDKINQLYDQGHEITIFTARGSTSQIDYNDLIVKQLTKWGVKYHKLICGKPSYDLFIDDKAISARTWRKEENIKIVGFVASCFDLLHAGHCLFLKEAKSVCDHLIAALQDDPSIDRPNKNKPIQSLTERTIQLESVKYIDQIVFYKTENDLRNLLEIIKPDIRILGSDSKDIPTGIEFCPNVYYHDRNHSFSSSELRQRLKHEH